MAKDVDLSSQEWRDLVFEGKNKEFGAYDMRKNSPNRHNKAMLIVLAVLALGLGVLLLLKAMPQTDDADILDQADQQMVAIDMSQEEEEQEEEEQERFEQEEPEALPEEILNTIKVTAIDIVPDEQVKKEDEIKSQDELKEATTAFGQTNFDKGTDEIGRASCRERVLRLV